MRGIGMGLAASLLALAGCQPDSRTSSDAASAAADNDAVVSDAAAHGANETASLDGTIAYRQRVALPKDATVVVKLLDLSRGSGADAVVSAHSFRAGGQVPIRFQLPYDPSRVSSQHAYGVEARILVDGALWFISAQPVAVLTRGAPPDAQVLLQMATQPG